MIYYIQEMIAVLIIFSALFVALAAVVFIVFLLDRGSQHIGAGARGGVRRLVHWMKDVAEGIMASPVWADAVPPRFRREQPTEEK